MFDNIIKILKSFKFINPNLDLIIIVYLVFFIFILSYILYTENFINSIIAVLIIFVFTGMLFIYMESEYLAFMFLIIYGGAIVILFICCFMLMSFKPIKIKFNNMDYVLYILYIFSILLFLNLILESLPNLVRYYSSFDFNVLSLYNIHKIQEELVFLKFFAFHESLNFIDLSLISTIGYILYTESWFETLYIGVLLILSIIVIVYILKK